MTAGSKRACPPARPRPYGVPPQDVPVARRRLRARASGWAGGASRPVDPGSTMSTMPFTAVATTGRPALREREDDVNIEAGGDARGVYPEAREGHVHREATNLCPCLVEELSIPCPAALRCSLSISGGKEDTGSDCDDRRDDSRLVLDELPELDQLSGVGEDVGVLDTKVDPGRQPGTGEVLFGHRFTPCIDLNSRDMASGRSDSVGEPKRRVAVRGAEFEHATGPSHG
jgi:hypothetical protein